MKYRQIPQHTDCPVCCTNSAHLLWEVSNEQAAQHFVLRESQPERFRELASHIECLWGHNTCAIVQCDQCGFCYSHPYIAGDQRFYTLAYDRSGYPPWKWEFQRTYDALAKFAKPDMHLLELGAGDGAFVKRIAQDLLPKQNILCTEFSEYGMRKIQACGVKCLSDDVRDLTQTELQEVFDIVCMFQVLEHMDRLDDLFERLSWLLKPGGSLFIAVPNARRIQFNELNGALLDMPPNHIGRWNQKCFENIGKRTGFRVENFKIEDLGYASMFKQFAIYRFLRNSQRSNSFENRICRIKHRQLLRIMQLIGVAMNAIMAIPKLATIDSGMGNSQWVQLIKLQN